VAVLSVGAFLLPAAALLAGGLLVVFGLFSDPHRKMAWILAAACLGPAMLHQLMEMPLTIELT
jgi:hypothetical protein